METLTTWRRFWRAHALLRFLALHALAGFALAGLFVAGLALSDFGGVASMIERSGAWPVYVLLWLFCGLTFASVQMGMGLMSLEDESGEGGGGAAAPAQLLPAKAAVAKPAVANQERHLICWHRRDDPASDKIVLSTHR